MTMTMEGRIDRAMERIGWQTVDGREFIRKILDAAVPELTTDPPHWLAPHEASEEMIEAAAMAMWEVWRTSEMAQDYHRGISWAQLREWSKAGKAPAPAYRRIGLAEAHAGLLAAFLTASSEGGGKDAPIVASSRYAVVPSETASATSDDLARDTSGNQGKG
jgi:hypothetical protein